MSHDKPKPGGSVREDLDALLADSASKIGRLVGDGERAAFARGARRLSQGLAAVAGELFDAAADQSARVGPRRRSKGKVSRADSQAQDES